MPPYGTRERGVLSPKVSPANPRSPDPAAAAAANSINVLSPSPPRTAARSSSNNTGSKNDSANRAACSESYTRGYSETSPRPSAHICANDKVPATSRQKEEQEEEEEEDDDDENQAQNSSTQGNPRQRSRHGCFTCRRRKKRCDEGKPVCKACVRLKLACVYPLPGLERKNRKRKTGALSQDETREEELRKRARVERVERVEPVAPAPRPAPPPGVAASTTFPEIENDILSSLETMVTRQRANGLRDQHHRPAARNGSSDHAAGAYHAYAAGTGAYHHHNAGAYHNGLSHAHDYASLINGPATGGGGASSFSGSLPDLLQSSSPASPRPAPTDPGPAADPGPSAAAAVFRSLHSLLASPSPATATLAATRSPRIEELCNSDEDNDNDNSNSNSNSTTTTTSTSHDPPARPSSTALVSTGASTPFESYDFANMRTPDILAVLTNVGASPGASPGNIPASPDTILLSAPTPWYSLYLDHFGIEMFSYYNNTLANMICISSKMNSFINVFVPMAQEDPSVLYALVAYAAFHHNMGRYEDIGLKYLNKAIKMVRNDIPKHNLTTLACILIITTAEICKGDMVHWNRHLSAAADVIQMRGGMEAFIHDPTKRWLATNFVYHDLLAASKYEHKSHFDAKDVDLVLRMDTGVHTLVGCCKPLFALLAEISDLGVEAQELYCMIASPYPAADTTAEYSAAPASVILGDSSSEFISHSDNTPPVATGSTNAPPTQPLLASQRKISEKIRDLHHRVDLLEAKIDGCKPDPNDILSLSKSNTCDLEQQLTLFETFQLTAKLHLYQSIGRHNAASLQMQVLAAELITSIDVVLNTKVEGSLVFPLFIASIVSITPRQRRKMVRRFESFYQRQLARNIVRALNLAQEVWKLDMDGTRYVNWYKVLEQHGWDICFA